MEKPVKGLCESTARILSAYDFPGNVRELEHAMERGVALCSGNSLEPLDLPPHFLAARSEVSSSIGRGGECTADMCSLSDSMGDYQRQLIVDALQKTGGRKADAARLLNISRKTLWQKLKQMETPEASR
jgi:DNA-binding NtrC family response regulator